MLNLRNAVGLEICVILLLTDIFNLGPATKKKVFCSKFKTKFQPLRPPQEFKCPTCQKIFKYRQSLAIHKKNHCNVLRLYTCSHCKAVMKYRDLVVHVNTVHLGKSFARLQIVWDPKLILGGHRSTTSAGRLFTVIVYDALKAV